VVADLSGLSLSPLPDKARGKPRFTFDSGVRPSITRDASSTSSVLGSPHTPSRQSHTPVASGSPLTSVLHLSPSVSLPLALDWPKLYRDRYMLDRRWEEGSQVAKTLKGHEDSVYCLQVDARKIVTGSVRPFL
jgi:F-box and WD-40 domain protein 1/11